MYHNSCDTGHFNFNFVNSGNTAACGSLSDRGDQTYAVFAGPLLLAVSDQVQDSS